jgi:hypothetical protein
MSTKQSFVSFKSIGIEFSENFGFVDIHCVLEFLIRVFVELLLVTPDFLLALTPHLEDILSSLLSFEYLFFNISFEISIEIVKFGGLVSNCVDLRVKDKLFSNNVQLFLI